ncbi:hypothetical protein TPHA_0E03850 [Tetrapisispora phaffii CBS 4417]|uniref:non-specific serine/threonine protein kinase n=1 Tax=Tetrapisispora phaffii (strain ATCC 24235 / CBS 4417 / NBRC 1672 / NRRL Y-8282 / UCD 70-5) TaxID=1071381 RepID=G8BU96_TETPH|nr:hypothetical protein TPHA_0E03850 [Tetrapisispora phaffii CBS 4417]CCE63474.1 hypothetical protein TPHA_0E03850 [Tetrapisispora phaffii CBS 4417]
MTNSVFEKVNPLTRYTIQDCVGRGNFGDVYKAIDKNESKVVAIKIVNLENTDEDIELLTQEIFFLSELKSPFITNYITTLTEDVTMWIVMEYCGGGSCADLIKMVYSKGIPESKVSYILRDTVKGLKYLHDQKKIHRDIKAANILLTDCGKVKLGDFGVSGQIRATMKRGTFVGTPYWMAPEVINKQCKGYNEKADIWSLGITAYELLKGVPPLSKYDPFKVMLNIPKRKPPKLHGQYSEKAKYFVSLCLIKDPKQRPSIEALLETDFLLPNTVLNLKEDVDLIKSIKLKNNYSKTPKYQLNQKIYDGSENIMSWNFDVSENNNSIQEIYENNIQTTEAATLQKMSELEKSPTTPTLDMRTSKPSSQLETPMTNISERSFRRLDKTKNNIVAGKITNTNDSKTSSEKNLFDLKEFDYLKNVINYSFTRMHERAKDEETKYYVDGIMSNFTKTESQVPGFSEVFIEEISLRMTSIKEYIASRQ